MQWTLTDRQAKVLLMNMLWSGLYKTGYYLLVHEKRKCWKAL